MKITITSTFTITEAINLLKAQVRKRYSLDSNDDDDDDDVEVEVSIEGVTNIKTLEVLQKESERADRQDLIDHTNDLIDHRNKIGAVKLFRSRLKCGLREAKDMIESKALQLLFVETGKITDNNEETIHDS